MGAGIESTTLATGESVSRQGRLVAALVESGVGSTTALLGLLATLYRSTPDVLAHVQRVALMSLRMGAGLGLSDEDLRQLERAALTHELGKIAVPDPPHVFGPGEAALPLRQVLAARDALRRVPFLAPAAAIVGALCEWADGSGGPLGLSGGTVPMTARILAVADMHDRLMALGVMLALEPETIAAELVSQAGRRFDAQVVAVCLRCMGESGAAAGGYMPQRGL